MITLTLHSAESPAIVAQSLKAQAGEWRTAQLPEALRRSGVLAVESKLDAGRCTLSYRRRWYGPVERLKLRARATIAPEARGTLVHIEARYNPPNPWLVALLVAVVTVVGVMMPASRPGWSFVVLAFVLYALSVLVVQAMNRNLSRASNSEADYLIGRLEHAVASAGSVESPTPRAD